MWLGFCVYFLIPLYVDSQSFAESIPDMSLNLYDGRAVVCSTLPPLLPNEGFNFILRGVELPLAVYTQVTLRKWTQSANFRLNLFLV